MGLGGVPPPELENFSKLARGRPPLSVILERILITNNLVIRRQKVVHLDLIYIDRLYSIKSRTMNIHTRLQIRPYTNESRIFLFPFPVIAARAVTANAYLGTSIWVATITPNIYLLTLWLLKKLVFDHFNNIPSPHPRARLSRSFIFALQHCRWFWVDLRFQGISSLQWLIVNLS